MKKHIPFIPNKKLNGSTIAELLIVMIVSGILFLLLFDGLNIVQRYGRILDRKLTDKSDLLYSHQVLEMLLEKTDSIRRNENELLLYMGHDQSVEHLYMDSSRVLFYKTDAVDTLFRGYTEMGLHSLAENTSQIDSLYISMRIGKDTVRLEYGLPPYTTLTQNEPEYVFD